jgi:fatty acid kinase fatty acid binding subunit
MARVGGGHRVAVVTDSTAALPAELVERYGLIVVPLQVVIGGRAYDEGPEATPERVAAALDDGEPVRTSRPAPQTFLEAYEAAAGAGAESIVSVHLSGDVSGTVEAAALAARDASVPVEVVDSRLVGMGTGYAVLAAAEAVGRGADAAAAAASARKRAAATTSLFYVDTLEYLRRGGRIGAAAAFLGSALAVKPLLKVDGGRIVALDRVRTSTRALHRLEDLAVAASADAGPVDIAVHHLASPLRAETLSAHLRERVPALDQLLVCEVGAVIGAHVGPGMVAAVVAPA